MFMCFLQSGWQIHPLNVGGVPGGVSENPLFYSVFFGTPSKFRGNGHALNLGFMGLQGPWARTTSLKKGVQTSVQLRHEALADARLAH